MLHQQRPSISLQEHPEFLALLQNEDFVEELTARPAEVLAKYDVDLASADSPSAVKLPDASSFVEDGAVPWSILI